MAYLGIDPKAAYSSYRNIDDISASFDGFVTTFPLRVGGIAPPILPINEQQVLINVGGVPQQPDPSGVNGFKLAAGNIIFSSAPSAGETFWGVILASANYISANTRFADGSAGLPSVTFASDVTTGIYSPGTGQLAISTGGTGELFVNTSGIQVPGDVQANSYNGGPLAGTRNRIINGDMRIDQRNASGGITPANFQYTVDRWRANLTQAGKFTTQQNSGSVTPPVGHINYLGVISTSAYSVVASDVFALNQAVEGLNVSDLGWGAAGAQSVTLSFWVRSSLTGTFGGAFQNSAQNRSYPFTYTVSAANTWEQKTITIAGDTSGTWLTTTDVGINLFFSLGAGTTFSGAAGSWSGSNFFSATGATSVVGTNGATFYITGVQLEPGTVATPFERRTIGQELALCQRYFERGNGILLAAFSGGTFGGGITNYQFKATKRVTPTAITTAAGTGAGLVTTFQVASLDDRLAIWWNGAAVLGDYREFTFTASSEL